MFTVGAWVSQGVRVVVVVVGLGPSVVVVVGGGRDRVVVVVVVGGGGDRVVVVVLVVGGSVVVVGLSSSPRRATARPPATTATPPAIRKNEKPPPVAKPAGTTPVAEPITGRPSGDGSDGVGELVVRVTVTPLGGRLGERAVGRRHVVLDLLDGLLRRGEGALEAGRSARHLDVEPVPGAAGAEIDAGPRERALGSEAGF
jgi:hypothetical protein